MVKVFNGKEFRFINGVFVSPMQIMKSNAGFYIGRSALEDGMELPFDRVTGYFGNKKDGEAILARLLS